MTRDRSVASASVSRYSMVRVPNHHGHEYRPATAELSLSDWEELCNHHDLTPRKFERVLVSMRIFQIDLAKPCHLVIKVRFAEQNECAIMMDVVVKGQFGSGTQSHCDIWFADCSEAAGKRILQMSAHKPVADLRRP